MLWWNSLGTTGIIERQIASLDFDKLFVNTQIIISVNISFLYGCCTQWQPLVLAFHRSIRWLALVTLNHTTASTEAREACGPDHQRWLNIESTNRAYSFFLKHYNAILIISVLYPRFPKTPSLFFITVFLTEINIESWYPTTVIGLWSWTVILCVVKVLFKLQNSLIYM